MNTIDQVGISDDRKAAKLIIAGTELPPLSTAEVDELISTLRAVRCEMAPPHADSYPIGRQGKAIIDPPCVIEAEQSMGGSLFHIRDPGFGFLHYAWLPASVAKMVELLQSHLYSSRN